jgi:hypothetical protein
VEGREKPHIDKYKTITNDWNYDASCTLASLPAWDLDNFKCLFLLYRVYVSANIVRIIKSRKMG